MSRSILNLSADADMASLRARVMSQAGFHVHTISRFDGKAQLPAERFDIMMVCYSVPSSEVERLTSDFRDQNPGACVIAILRMPWDPNCEYADECVQALEGPAALIKAVKECKPKANSAAV